MSDYFLGYYILCHSIWALIKHDFRYVHWMFSESLGIIRPEPYTFLDQTTVGKPTTPPGPDFTCTKAHNSTLGFSMRALSSITFYYHGFPPAVFFFHIYKAAMPDLMTHIGTVSFLQISSSFMSWNMFYNKGQMVIGEVWPATIQSVHPTKSFFFAKFPLQALAILMCCVQHFSSSRAIWRKVMNLSYHVSKLAWAEVRKQTKSFLPSNLWILWWNHKFNYEHERSCTQMCSQITSLSKHRGNFLYINHTHFLKQNQWTVPWATITCYSNLYIWQNVL